MHRIWLPSPLFMWDSYHRLYKAKKTIPPHFSPSQYLMASDLYNCYTAVSSLETRQLAGDYWLGANATAVLNIYACEYRHFGFSGGLVVHDLQCKHGISGVKANLKRLVIILCNTCRQMRLAEIFKSKLLNMLPVGQEIKKYAAIIWHSNNNFF